jgi:hypothetical protein
MNKAIPIIPRERGGDLRKGTYSQGGEKIVFSYYDTCFIVASSTTAMHFFQSAQGQIANNGSTTKTLQHTNTSLGGQIPRGQKMRIDSIKMLYTAVAAFSAATILAWYKFLADTTLEFLINGKDSLLTITLQEVLGPAALIIPTVASSTGTELQARIILPRFHGIYPLSTPIVLAEQTNFEIRVTPQVATAATGMTGDYLKLCINGMLKRLS